MMKSNGRPHRNDPPTQATGASVADFIRAPKCSPQRTVLFDRAKIVGGLLAVAVLVAAATRVAQSTTILGLCLASKVDGQIVLSEMSHRKWSFLLGHPFRTAVSGIEIWGDDVAKGRFLWAVDAAEQPLAWAIIYGNIPVGYTQRWPIRGEPEPLQESKTYGINCGNGLGRFKLTADGVVNLATE